MKSTQMGLLSAVGAAVVYVGLLTIQGGKFTWPPPGHPVDIAVEALFAAVGVGTISYGASRKRTVPPKG